MVARELERTLSLITSSLIFLYHALTAYLCTYLPSDPLYVSLSVAGYAWYACALSLLGVWGSYKRSPTFLTIFSNHLLLDTMLSMIPKVGILYLFHDLTRDMCLGSLSASFWLPSGPSSLHGPGRVMVQGVEAGSFAEQLKARRNCETGLLVAQVVLIAVICLWTAAQWGLGLYIRRYAVKLEIQQGLGADESGRDIEKAFYEEDSLADGYTDAMESVREWSWGRRDREYDEKEALEKEALVSS